MVPRVRPGIATYLQTFILLGIAVGGATLAYGTMAKYASSARGPAVAVSNPTIRQGPLSAWGSIAVERMTLYNIGPTSFSSFTLSTPAAPTSAPFCYSLSPSAGPPSSTCPPATGNPSYLSVLANISPGGAVTIELTVVSTSSTRPIFNLGTGYTVIVGASSAAQVSMIVVAVAA